MPVIRREDLVDEKGRTVEVYEESVDEGDDTDPVEYPPEDVPDEDPAYRPPSLLVPEQYQIVYTYNGIPVCPFAAFSTPASLYLYSNKKEAIGSASGYSIYGNRDGIGIAVIETPSAVCRVVT